MQTITLYRYIRKDGGVTVSTVKPEGEYTEMVRLVADEGKALTQDGENLTFCVDTDSTDGWYEVEAVDPAELNRQYTETDEPIDPIKEVQG